MNVNEALISLINYLEKAQSRGAFTLKESREIANSIDAISTPGPSSQSTEEKEEVTQ